MKRITFKSNPENWRKEYLGLKKNTIRQKDIGLDARFDILAQFINQECNMLEIEIENTETGEAFVRTVTDVTLYNNWYIISWK